MDGIRKRPPLSGAVVACDQYPLKQHCIQIVVHPILTFTEADTNYMGTRILSSLDCIGVDARTALELVHADQLCGHVNPSVIDL